MNNIMIDIETLSTRKDALVVSIGAVRFDNKSLGEEFYAPCFHQQSSRRIDMSTLRWWMSQGEEAREVFTNKEQKVLSLREALIELKDFIDKDDIIWANGVTFDIGILEDALIDYKYKIPWKFSNLMCLRSIRTLFPEYKEIVEKIRGESPSHNALDDAKCQALSLIEIMNNNGLKL